MDHRVKPRDDDLAHDLLLQNSRTRRAPTSSAQPALQDIMRRLNAAHPSRRAPHGALLWMRIGRCGGYLSLIGAAVFSAGAGGSAVAAPAFCASASGRAGCGGTSLGRAPVVVGSGGADGLVSAPGVDCNGCVACAICRLLALSWASERPDKASPDTISADASSISILKARFLSSEDMSFTAYRWWD